MFVCVFGVFLQWNKHCTIDLTSSYYTTNKRCKSVICNTNLDFVVVYNASSIAMVIEQMICIILDSSFLFYYYYYYYYISFFFLQYSCRLDLIHVSFTLCLIIFSSVTIFVFFYLLFYPLIKKQYMYFFNFTFKR